MAIFLSIVQKNMHNEPKELKQNFAHANRFSCSVVQLILNVNYAFCIMYRIN